MGVRGETYQGLLCQHNHEIGDTGQSLRYVKNNKCVTCSKSQFTAGRRHLRTPKSKAAGAICNIRDRATAKGLPFDLDSSWYVDNMPKLCPILQIPLVFGGHRNDSPSVDRLIPKLGYLKTNCRIISNRANKIKSNATLEELKELVSWLEKELQNLPNQTILEQ